MTKAVKASEYIDKVCNTIFAIEKKSILSYFIFNQIHLRLW